MNFLFYPGKTVNFHRGYILVIENFVIYYNREEEDDELDYYKETLEQVAGQWSTWRSIEFKRIII